MGIGILFESKEWSSFELERRIKELGVEAKLIDLQSEYADSQLMSEIICCDLIVNRVFASAVFRGNERSLELMPGIIHLLQKENIPMINPYEAHFYEISKECSTTKLAENGFWVPGVYGVFFPWQIQDKKDWQYPFILKPDCGGRTNYTFIINDEKELLSCVEHAPNIRFIAEEYIEPSYGFLTRIEVIGDACKLILKRSVADNGLSAYHLGSTYKRYDDCREEIKVVAVKAMELLKIETGSLDIIENERGFYIIDVNAVSNTSEDCTEVFGFDLMKETAEYIVKRYFELKGIS